MGGVLLGLIEGAAHLLGNYVQGTQQQQMHQEQLYQEFQQANAPKH
jgi:hypothetical protein